MGLPNVLILEKIFDDYLTSLNHQSGTKKNGVRMWNSVKSTFGFGRGNPYIEKDPEQTKRERITHFKTQFKEASSLPNDRAVISWRKLLDIFHDEYKLIIDAEIFNESKFGFAIRAASAEICKAIADQPIILTEMATHQSRLHTLHDSIRKSINSASTPIQSEVDERNDILLKLTKLGDKDAAHEAARLNILPTDKNHKPDEQQFTLPPSSNAHVINDAEIYPGLPWAYQPNLLKLYEFRLEMHEFPTSIALWEKWKRDRIQKAVDAEQALIKQLAASKLAAERAITDQKAAEIAAAQKAEDDKKAAQAPAAQEAEKASLEKSADNQPIAAASSSAAILELLPPSPQSQASAAAAEPKKAEVVEQKTEEVAVSKQPLSFLNASNKSKNGKEQHAPDSAWAKQTKKVMP